MNREELLKLKGKKIAVDIDKTITIGDIPDFMATSPNEQIKLYEETVPDEEMIEFFNKVAENNQVYYYTARNNVLNGVTNRWLDKHNVKRTHFVTGKEGYDVFIDDKAWNVDVVHKDRFRTIEHAHATLNKLSETESEIVLKPLWDLMRLIRK